MYQYNIALTIFAAVTITGILGGLPLKCCSNPGCTQWGYCAEAETISCWNLTTVEGVAVIGGCYCQQEKDGCHNPHNITLYDKITLAEYLTEQLQDAGVPQQKINDIVNGTACFCNSDLCNKQTKAVGQQLSLAKMPKSFYRRLYKNEQLKKWILF